MWGSGAAKGFWGFVISLFSVFLDIFHNPQMFSVEEVQLDWHEVFSSPSAFLLDVVCIFVSQQPVLLNTLFLFQHLAKAEQLTRYCCVWVFWTAA